MACTSGSVKKVADNVQKAKEQIDKLQAMIADQNANTKTKFFAEIDKHLADAGICDAREIGYQSDIKTEYTSEFNIDGIAKVVTAALKAVAAAKNPSVPNPAMSPEAIQAYTDVVTSVAEAAKSSSEASASLSFSMIRLAPGLFAFLTANSVSIKDQDTFGSEAVSSTAIYYRTMESNQDIEIATQHEQAYTDYLESLLRRQQVENVHKLRTVQAWYMDELMNGKIDMDTWMKSDTQMSKIIELAEQQLKANKAQEPTAPRAHPMFRPAPKSGGVSPETIKLVERSIAKLSTMGPKYQLAIERSKKRLEEGYY